MTMGFASHTVLPMSSSGRRPGRAVGMKEAAGGVDRTVGLDAVMAAGDVVFLAVTGRGVDGAGALFERHIVGQDAERIALEKRMAENGVLHLGAGEAGEHLVFAPSALFGGDLGEIGGDDVDVARDIHRDILVFRMEGDGHVGGNGPGGGGPDEPVDLAAGERGDGSSTGR